MKLYLYGYLNRIRSSRRLEKKAQRNVEVMWLLKKLTPDFKTIADFRKDNHKAFKPLFRQFTLVCKELDLFGAELLAVDGSKFAAQNNKDKNFTRAKLERWLQAVDEKIEPYLRQMDAGDAGEAVEASSGEATATASPEKIQALQQRKERYGQLLQELQKREARGETQLSLTDPDSRSMPKSPKVDVGYNVQVAVDSKHKLIVEQEVSNAVTDQNQLSTSAIAAKETLGVDKIDVAADRGYYDGPELKKCQAEGITCYHRQAGTRQAAPFRQPEAGPLYEGGLCL